MSDSVDLSFLRTLMGNDEALVSRFIRIFTSQCPQQLQELRQHLQNQDWPSLSTVAHSMKTQFTYLNAEALAAQAIEIETRADEGRTDDLTPLIDSFEGACIMLLATFSKNCNLDP